MGLKDLNRTSSITQEEAPLLTGILLLANAAQSANAQNANNNTITFTGNSTIHLNITTPITPTSSTTANSANSAVLRSQFIDINGQQQDSLDISLSGESSSSEESQIE